MRNGLNASRLYLPNENWPDLLSFLQHRFPFLSDELIRQRLDAGDIVDEAGVAQTVVSPFKPDSWLWYYREVEAETVVPFEVEILYQDELLVVVDKPHFLASVPAGKYLQETALVRLKAMLDEPEISPLHRLDKDTAGVLVFCRQKKWRGVYQQLFQAGQMSKVYEAVAPVDSELAFPLVRESRIEKSEQYFKMQEVAGEPNSRTRIELLSAGSQFGHYRLFPESGKKHQLRVQMNALGVPICNDSYYPVLLPEKREPDYSKPLQLLASRLKFVDPVTQEARCFESRRELGMVGLCR